MKNYQVKICEVYSTIVDVEAENEDEARQRANERLENDDLGEGEYDYTLEPEEWQVWEG